MLAGQSNRQEWASAEEVLTHWISLGYSLPLFPKATVINSHQAGLLTYPNGRQPSHP